MKLGIESLLHVLPCSLADLFGTPDGSACGVFHGLPEVRLRIQASIFDLIGVEDSLPLVKMLVDGRLVVIRVSNVRDVLLLRFAAFTEEISDTPFDDVGVQEEGILGSVIGGVRLNHANS